MGTVARVVLGIVLLAGCASPKLRMMPVLEPHDESVIHPRLTAQRYQRIMIVPPPGTSPAQLDHEISLFEREFLKNNLTVISGSVSGRVILESSGAEQTRLEGLGRVSDSERSLMLAKQSGADAILQISQLGWTRDKQPTRYFVLDKEDYREATVGEYRAWSGEKIEFESAMLSFLGRLIDVQSGQVLASFQVGSAANWNLPMDYTAEVTAKRGGKILKSESFPYYTDTWASEAREKTMTRVIQTVARRIVGQ
jgi:hypothetical protein